MFNIKTFDAQSALGFVVSQTSLIETEVNRIQYPDLVYRELVPISTEGSPFVTSVTYFSADQYGKADWINGNSDDIPRAGTTRAQHQTPVYTAGIGYGYGWEEIGRAQLLGINLSAEDAAAARRASEEMIEQVALEGDASKGFEGLYNNSNVVPIPATKPWIATSGAATALEIVGDINDALQNVFNGTNTVALADTLLLPWAHYNMIATRPMSTDNPQETILSWVLKHNIYTANTGRPLRIRGVRYLDTAGVSAVPRMIAYRYDRRTMVMHIPMPHQFMPAYQSGPLRWDIPGVMRLGGLDIRLPKEVVYMDGL